MNTKLRKVLIAEDDLSLKPIWEEFFSRLNGNFSLQWTVSCEEALKILEKAVSERNEFDLIISDIFLAGSGTGMELLNSPLLEGTQAKRLLISAVDRDQILEEYADLTENIEVISKPFNGKLYEPIITGLLSL